MGASVRERDEKLADCVISGQSIVPGSAFTSPSCTADFSPGKIAGAAEQLAYDEQASQKKFNAPHWLDQVRDLDIFHGRLSKYKANRLLKKNGDYLLRSAMDKRDGFLKLVLSVRWDDRSWHFLIRENFGLYRVDSSLFQSIPCLLAYHHNSGEPIHHNYRCCLMRPIPTGLTAQSFASICEMEKNKSSAQRPMGVEPFSAEDKEMPEILNQVLTVLLAAIGITFLYLCVYF
ncbi:unnamed protein product [Bursaphelenchus xylophilus]|uniref:(pine wood nematode) hypothetical protein n=1 Tax=Bursaphelenchus xylophilus TaxID=6326 RepID=A0A1I7S0L8_BURXY|nr:unnamed protein product [Bursaphelenchus xylophilus]CAG9132335.1 unnamed protein product [Bursaphelenchus xylophilus]